MKSLIWNRLAFVGALGVAMGSGGAGPAQAYSFTGLGDLPGGVFLSFVFDVSADGSAAVGVSDSSGGNQEAFRWTADGSTALLVGAGISALAANRRRL